MLGAKKRWRHGRDQKVYWLASPRHGLRCLNQNEITKAALLYGVVRNSVEGPSRLNCICGSSSDPKRSCIKSTNVPYRVPVDKVRSTKFSVIWGLERPVRSTPSRVLILRRCGRGLSRARYSAQRLGVPAHRPLGTRHACCPTEEVESKAFYGVLRTCLRSRRFAWTGNRRSPD